MLHITCGHCAAVFQSERRRTYCYECQPPYGSISTTEYTRIAVRLNQHKVSGRHGACCGIDLLALHNEAKREAKRREPIVPPPRPLCAVCNEVVPVGRRTLCSDACNAERFRQRMRAIRAERPDWYVVQRKQWHRNRRNARLKVESERYDPQQIAARDKWRCSLCGKKIDHKAVAPQPQSLTMDHVLPLSLGGADTPANVRAAHHVCNSAKGNRVANNGEQLMIVG